MKYRFATIAVLALTLSDVTSGHARSSGVDVDIIEQVLVKVNGEIITKS
jgi:hypothetical protein